MTIFYLDAVAGNDANTGLSWAQAWKTFLNGPTAVRLNPGDEVRVAKSPDPTNVSSATWTDRKIQPSVTFAAAPTKQIDAAQAGWVSLGAGATVTNNQATAYMMWGTTPGTGSALQVVNAASLQGAYKDLGVVTDFSAHQQVCFWFRPSAAFDCTGAQNLNIRLCSDAAGVTVVNTLVAPKWNYAANTWYPIVIDNGAALGSNIRSISYNTTNTHSLTFYFAEFFASPASGLTLWSLIEDNDDTLYPIRSIRNADVYLMAAYAPTVAGGGCLTSSMMDTAWIGTTATFTTRKRETYKMYATTGPAATTWCQTNRAGVWVTGTKTLCKYTFGWDTGTTTQNGYTFADNLVCLGTVLNNTNLGWRFENLVAVRVSTGITLTGNAQEWDKIGCISATNVPLNFAGFSANNLWDLASKLYRVDYYTNGTTNFVITFGTGCSGATLNLPNIWGNSIFTFTLMQTTVVGKNIVPSTASNLGGNIAASNNSRMTFNRIEGPVVTGSTSGSAINGLTLNSSFNDYISIVSMNCGTAGVVASNSFGTVVDVGTFAGAGSFMNPSCDGIIARCASNISSNVSKWIPVTNPQINNKLYVQDINGPGTASVFVGLSSQGAAVSYFDLQTGDVHTVGSKAWKYFGNGFAAGNIGSTNTLKLASAAAVANKLVTVTAYVKRTAANQQCGIRVPAIFLPGYTTNQSVTFTGTTGTWQLLTITFTPTQDCVFDVEAWVLYDSLVAATDAVWDDLTITQAP